MSGARAARRRAELVRRLLAGFAAGGLLLSLLVPAAVEAPAPACCRGRCCCSAVPAPQTPCLRAACGCRPEAPAPGSLRIDLALPPVARGPAPLLPGALARRAPAPPRLPGVAVDPDPPPWRTHSAPSSFFC